MDPGAVLADVGHLQQVRIQTGVLAGPAEGLLVQVRRAGGHDDAREALLLDVLFDQALAQRRAHELVVAGDGHVLDVLARPARDLFHVDRAGDVAAAMTDVNADFLRHRCVPVLNPKSQISNLKSQISNKSQRLGTFWIFVFGISDLFGISCFGFGICFSYTAAASFPFNFAASTGMAATSSLPKPSFFGSRPKAMPRIWVKYRIGRLNCVLK